MDKGCSKEEINSTLKEYYFVSDKKSEILYNVAKKERYILDNSEQDMVEFTLAFLSAPPAAFTALLLPIR